MKRIVLGYILCLASVVALLAGYAAWHLGMDIRAYRKYAHQLKTDLGFDHGSPYVKIDNQINEVFTLHPTLQNGTMTKAGLRDGDIVFDSFTINKFYSELERHRGRKFLFRVADGGDGPPLRERNQRIISIKIPEKSKTSK